MQYTLAEAIEELKGNSLVYTDGDLTSKINKAIRALSRMKGWQCLRKVLRFSSVGPCFTLPQGCAGLVRVCVNGRPMTVRGQDFRFIHSGPGDDMALRSRKVPPGFSIANNVMDDGKSAIMVEPQEEFAIFAYRDNVPTGTTAAAEFTFTGTDINGRAVRSTVPIASINTWPEYDPTTGEKTSGSGPEPSSATLLPFELMSLDSVTVSSTTNTYITLYAALLRDTTVRFPIAQYRPGVLAPFFRRYHIPGIRPGQPIELLVEARIDPMPLVNPTDILPFETIEPIEWMIRSDWEMRSGEVSKGESYRNNAANWLMAQEVTDDTVQTSFVINSPFAGSAGEISAEAENI